MDGTYDGRKSLQDSAASPYLVALSVVGPPGAPAVTGVQCQTVRASGDALTLMGSTWK